MQYAATLHVGDKVRLRTGRGGVAVECDGVMGIVVRGPYQASVCQGTKLIERVRVAVGKDYPYADHVIVQSHMAEPVPAQYNPAQPITWV